MTRRRSGTGSVERYEDSSGNERFRARLVLAMACVPQNFFFYDQFPLLLAARSRTQCLAIALTSQVAGIASTMWIDPSASAPVRSAAAMPYAMLGLYLPAIACVLAPLIVPQPLRRHELST